MERKRDAERILLQSGPRSVGEASTRGEGEGLRVPASKPSSYPGRRINELVEWCCRGHATVDVCLQMRVQEARCEGEGHVEGISFEVDDLWWGAGNLVEYIRLFLCFHRRCSAVWLLIAALILFLFASWGAEVSVAYETVDRKGIRVSASVLSSDIASLT